VRTSEETTEKSKQLKQTGKLKRRTKKREKKKVMARGENEGSIAGPDKGGSSLTWVQSQRGEGPTNSGVGKAGRLYHADLILNGKKEKETD